MKLATINMRPPIDHIGLAATELNRLRKSKINDREFRKRAKIILAVYGTSINSRTDDYVKRLEEEVKDYRTIKRLLK